jgi:RNA polymerase sigma-70 factor (ECF subfamily)
MQAIARAIEPAREQAAELREPSLGSDCTQHPQFAEIFARYRGPIFKLCLNLTGNSADAEDAFQAAFLAIYQGLPSFSGRSKLSTWIFRVAVRVALRAKTSKWKADPLDADHPAQQPPDPAQRRETGEVLARAMASLSADHRLVLSLFAVEQLSHREIADLLDIPEGTVWSRLHVARKKLISQLSKGGYSREDL